MGVGTGEETMPAGWKLLYRLQELIKPPLEKRGTNGKCFCILCLKLTWEQGAGARVPALGAAGGFVQWPSCIWQRHRCNQQGLEHLHGRAATDPVPDAAPPGKHSLPGPRGQVLVGEEGDCGWLPWALAQTGTVAQAWFRAWSLPISVHKAGSTRGHSHPAEVGSWGSGRGSSRRMLLGAEVSQQLAGLALPTSDAP